MFRRFLCKDPMLLTLGQCWISDMYPPERMRSGYLKGRGTCCLGKFLGYMLSWRVCGVHRGLCKVL